MLHGIKKLGWTRSNSGRVYKHRALSLSRSRVCGNAKPLATFLSVIFVLSFSFSHLSCYNFSVFTWPEYNIILFLVNASDMLIIHIYVCVYVFEFRVKRESDGTFVKLLSSSLSYFFLSRK